MTYPLRQFDDKAVLRTDGSDSSIAAAYARAERVFDPNDAPTQAPTGPDLYGKTGLSEVKPVFHQIAQMETAFLDRDNPATMVAQAYTDH